MRGTLYDKVFDLHAVDDLGGGRYQLYIGAHFVNDVTSAVAFAALRDGGLPVFAPERTFALADHMVSTGPAPGQFPPTALERVLADNAGSFGIDYFGPGSGRHGIVHVVGPELGITQPGMTVCCGDSHTSTHGALGSVAFGIGSTQVRDVLATQTLVAKRLKTRRIWIDGALPNGALPFGVEAKDVILAIIRTLGVAGGIGYCYEYAGPAVDAMSVDERMTLCNMSVEGGAQVGYVNPDETTLGYLKGRPFAPPPGQWADAVRWWASMGTAPDATFDDTVELAGGDIAPAVTWGTHPGQNVPADGTLPVAAELPPASRRAAEEAFGYMGLEPGAPISGTKIDVAFIGSCANGRLTDIERVARFVRRAGGRVAPGVRALVVPGSESVYRDAREYGYAKTLTDAGFDFRRPGCSTCVGMNGDGLRGRELCASTSTRNFRGRQGSPTGRTLLMSPVMVAAAALAGEVTDVRTLARWTPRGGEG
ncbi:MAG: 3-isopropylmalate dehydratase large subunit [Nocardiopsaceae bacterium]|nr:3-isopropylmalate dehydratase large subunit [Nocardiopsaceae bacterium]